MQQLADRLFGEVEADLRPVLFGLAGSVVVDLDHQVRAFGQQHTHPRRQSARDFAGRPDGEHSLRGSNAPRKIRAAGLLRQLAKCSRGIDAYYGVVDYDGVSGPEIYRGQEPVFPIVGRQQEGAELVLVRRREAEAVLRRKLGIRRPELPARCEYRHFPQVGRLAFRRLVHPLPDQAALVPRKAVLALKLLMGIGFPGRHEPQPRHLHDLPGSLLDV